MKNEVFFAVCFNLLVAINAPSSLILSTLMMEATRFSELSVLTQLTLHYIREDLILQNSYLF
jgi:hypothetical protein